MTTPLIRPADISSVELRPWAEGEPAPEDVLRGDAQMMIAPLWTSPDGRIANGLFTCQPSLQRVTHAVEQTLVVLEGKMIYTEEGFSPIVRNAGDALVLHPGAKYLVEAVEPSTLFWTVTAPEGTVYLPGGVR